MKLLFVFNAGAGAGNALLDSLYKLARPEAQNCQLCSLTHGVLGERRAWKRFRRSAPVEMTFLHKDEFEREYRSKWLPRYEFPVVLAVVNSGLEYFLTRDEIEGLSSTDQLINLVRDRLGRG